MPPSSKQQQYNGSTADDSDKSSAVGAIPVPKSRLSDILSPRDAVQLLGIDVTRSFLRAYLRYNNDSDSGSSGVVGSGYRRGGGAGAVRESSTVRSTGTAANNFSKRRRKIRYRHALDMTESPEEKQEIDLLFMGLTHDFSVPCPSDRVRRQVSRAWAKLSFDAAIPGYEYDLTAEVLFDDYDEDEAEDSDNKGDSEEKSFVDKSTSSSLKRLQLVSSSPLRTTNPSSTKITPPPLPPPETYSVESLYAISLNRVQSVYGLDKYSFGKRGVLFPPTTVPSTDAHAKDYGGSANYHGSGHLALMDCLFNALVSTMPENIADDLMDEAVCAAAALTALASSRANSSSPSIGRRIRGLKQHASSTSSSGTPGGVAGFSVGTGGDKRGGGGGGGGGGSRSFSKSAHDDRMASITSTSVRGRRPRILLPDLLIVFAICRLAEIDMQYRGYLEERRLEKEKLKLKEQSIDLENNMVDGDDVCDNSDVGNDKSSRVDGMEEESSAASKIAAHHLLRSAPLLPPPPSPPREDGLLLVCLLAFRIYDGYQRQNNLTRDTLQRFLSDIHGEECNKIRSVRSMLDRVFTTVVLEPRRKLEPHEGDSLVGVAASSPSSTSTKRELKTIDSKIFHRGLQSTIVFLSNNSESIWSLPDDKAGATASPSIVGSHILLDWILTLFNCLLPRQMPPSPKVCEYHLRIVNSDPARMIDALSAKYGLYDGEVGDNALYEIRRRFHSLGQQHVTTPDRDGSEERIKSVDEDSIESDYNTGEVNEQGESSISAANVCENTGVLVPLEDGIDSSIGPKRPKNVIDEASFVKAVSLSSNDLGHGGYLTPELARWTFRACAGRAQEMREALSGNLWHDKVIKNRTIMNASKRRSIPTEGGGESYWTMYDVLSFGCEAVRFDALKDDNAGEFAEYSGIHSSEIPLLRLAFKTFLQLPRHQEDDTVEIEEEGNYQTSNKVEDAKMTRSQIGSMLLLLLGHESYRLKADFPVSEDGRNNMEAPLESHVPWSCQSVDGDRSDTSHHTLATFVDVSYASLLGLLPPNLESSQISKEASSHSILLSKLVDYVISEANDKSESSSTIDFHGFVRWHLQLSPSDKSDSAMAMPVRETRLGPYLVDLRLIASVLFGVRPASVIMEKNIIEEIQRRHKYRYPRNRERQPHGPRGTLWYVVNADWWRTWQHFTGKKNVDGDAEWRPVMEKIDNNSLLSVEGILSLKRGLHTHRDFELVEPLVWSALQAWYDGGPPITREVVPFTSRTNDAQHHFDVYDQLDIELYPLYASVFLCDKVSRGEPRPFQQFIPLSRYLPLKEVVFKLREGLGRDSKLQRYDCRLWLLDGVNVGSSRALIAQDSLGRILDLELTIIDERNLRGAKIGKDEESISLMLELRNDDGTWPRSQPNMPDVGDDGHGIVRTSDEKDEVSLGDGIVGLYNMG